MSTPDGSNRISQERLNQIAQRKLSALGVQHRLGPHGNLEGELRITSGRVTHPATGAALNRAAFEVMGHDHLRFLEGPFSGIGPVMFYDAESAALLENRVLQLLSQRVQRLREQDAKLKALGLRTSLDMDALLIRAIVKGVEQSYELLAGPEGVRLSQVIPRSGEAVPFPDVLPPLIPLQDISTAAELELFIEGLPEVRSLPLTGGGARPSTAGRAPGTAAGRPSAGAGAPTGGLRVIPAPAGALSLDALAKLNDEGVYLAGNEVVMEMEVEGRRHRFSAVHERGTTFLGRLTGPTGDKWKERFDAARFPGIVPFVRSLLGVPAPSPVASAPSSGTTGGPGTSGRSQTLPSLPAHLVPQPGEVWVMNVVVERDDGEEIRYVCTNIDGHPYGAARILKKSDFQAVFAPQGTGWRLRIRIAQLDPDAVSYQQLSPSGELSPTVKKIPPNIFAANFLPEAAAY